MACNDWYFTVKHNDTGIETPVQLHDNCLLIQPKGMQAHYKHKVHGTFNTFMRWVATIRDVDSETLQSWLSRKKRIHYARDYSNEAILRSWLCPDQRWIIGGVPIRPRMQQLHADTVMLGICVNCKTPFQKGMSHCIN